MIDLTVNRAQVEKNAKYCRERSILIPTLAQMRDPSKVPQRIKDELKGIGLWDIHARNLFRITWHNEPVGKGGGYGGVNHLVLPAALTGTKATIIGLLGKWFPTGAHKVGATFGCLVPRLVTGQFDPQNHKAVWPSTGNFCRGGAYVSALLGCKSIAILPEEMSRERFDWLSKIAGEVIATPGCESNVKEIFDKCWELKKTRKDVFIFNQFEEFGNTLWHHEVTGHAAQEVLKTHLEKQRRLAGIVVSSGSAGTTGCGYYLKGVFPSAKLAVAEALQCPTLLMNGFGGHRIEGIGDKHVPWIHDLKATDMIVAVDDEHPVRLLRLFNETEGRKRLKLAGVAESLVHGLEQLGISSLANLIAAIKFAKYYELAESDVVITVFTDSTELYMSRIAELNRMRGSYSEAQAERDHEMLLGLSTDSMAELGYYDRKRIHNLKYFTWIEQQQRQLSELNAQWQDHDHYWSSIWATAPKIEELIQQFNEMAHK